MSREEYSEEIEEMDLVEKRIPSRPRIYEGNHATIPAGFDAIMIDVDGRVQSDLNWKEAQRQAQQAIDQGYTLMWNMEMGLFKNLAQPLTHQAQFLSLTLALEHFRDSLWKEFKSHTLGVTLFQGSADFTQAFPWDDHQEQNFRNWLQDKDDGQLNFLSFSPFIQDREGKRWARLFCRDVVIEYLTLLASRLPDSLPAYLYLDTSSFSGSLLDEIQILNPERFDRLHLALKGHKLPFEALGWETPNQNGYSGKQSVELPELQSASIGVCLPPMQFYHSKYYEGLDTAVAALQEKGVAFKLIPEYQLTAQWDGLDDLFYHPIGLSTQGKRKLQGFCAAGGTVISTGSLLGLPYELNLQDWLKKF